MQLTSPAFTHSGPMPADNTCKGKNVSPALHIEGIPAAARSLTLIMHDPDAPNGDFTHWVVWNLAPVADIPEGMLPAGAQQGTNDFNQANYGGPCPPSGTHRYMFDLYALDVSLDLPQGAGRTDIETAIRDHIAGQTQLIGLVSAS